MNRAIIAIVLSITAMLMSGCGAVDNQMYSGDTNTEIPNKADRNSDTVQGVNPPTPAERSSYQQGTQF